MTAMEFEWGALVLAIANTLTFLCLVFTWQQHRRARRWRIRAEEADAWSDEYQRERDALTRQAADLMERNRELRDARCVLEAVMALRTRQLLAVNYSFIAYNVRRKRT